MKDRELIREAAEVYLKTMEDSGMGRLELPICTAEDYKQTLINCARAVRSQVLERCRKEGKPEPDPAQLAELEAKVINSGGAEWMVEHDHVERAWHEALQAGDPTVLKCKTEFLENLEKLDWKRNEYTRMMYRWYLANRGELKSPLWQKNFGGGEA